MPNTKQYNKEEVMKELKKVADLIKETQYQKCHQKKVGLSTTGQDFALDTFGEQFNNLLSRALTAAEQAGEERMRKFMKARDAKMFHYYKSVFQDGFEGGYPEDWDNIK